LHRKALLMLGGGVIALSVLFARQTRSSMNCGVCLVPKTQNSADSPIVDAALLHRNAEEEEARERGVTFHVMSHGDSHNKRIALTFDDGPHPSWTPRLLNLLDSLHVHATFFLVGKMVDRYPLLAEREVADGHEVASHTYSHPNLTKLTGEQVQSELLKGAEAIKRAVGYSPVYFRPPGGQYNEKTLLAAKAVGLTPVLWTVNSKDFLHPSPEVLEQRLLASPSNGSILLCHDGIEETMRILPDLVRRLRAKGYTFVTVSELAHQAGS
jgi:peptidoglycan/xylan/chitin deacetylase (PgdA/CDA1 family)